MRAADALGDRGAGRARQLDLMERAGARPGAGHGRRGAAGADADRGRQGQQRRRRAAWSRGCCARTATRWTCSRGRLDELRATRGQPRPLPGDRRAVRAGGWRGRAWWWTRCSAPASRARRASRWRRRSRRSTRQDAPVVACDVPSGVNASPARSRRRRCGPPPRPPSTARRSACTWTPGKEHAGRVEVVEIGIPRGAPEPARGRADLGARARPVPAPGARAARSSSPASWWWRAARAGLTGAPTMAARSAAARRRRLRPGGGARSRPSRRWTCGCSSR